MSTNIYLVSLARSLAIAASLTPLAVGAQALGQTQVQTQASNVVKADSPPSDMSAAEELARLQAQIPILEAKAEIAKLKSQIENAGSPPSGPAQGAPSPMTPWGGSPIQATVARDNASAAASAPAAKSEMRAISISGFDGRYQAILTIDGQTLSVRPGDTIEGGWKVSGINESSVTLARGKRVVVLRV